MPQDGFESRVRGVETGEPKKRPGNGARRARGREELGERAFCVLENRKMPDANLPSGVASQLRTWEDSGQRGTTETISACQMTGDVTCRTLTPDNESILKTTPIYRDCGSTNAFEYVSHGGVSFGCSTEGLTVSQESAETHC